MSSEYDNVFAQSLTAGSDFDDTVFAQNDSNLMDIVNKSGIYSSKFDCPECDDENKPITDSSQKSSAYANDDDMIDKKFNEACASLLEDLVSDEDDLAEMLNRDDDDDLFDDDDSDYEDYDDEDDDEGTAVDDSDGTDAPIPVDPASVKPETESFIYDQDKYAAFVEWAMMNRIPMSRDLLEAAKLKFAVHEDGQETSAPTKEEVKEVKNPTKTDKELADDAVDDEDDDAAIKDAEKDDGEVSDALAKDLNEDEDDEILSMILDI